MKRLLVAVILVVFNIGITAQAPQGFNYQAIIRNSNGTVKAKETISVQISIVDETGAASYIENHNTQTNEFGLVNLVIGQGTTSGDFSMMNWSDGPYYIDITVNGVNLGSSPLLSVPYAMYTETANSAKSADQVDWEDIQTKPVLFDLDPSNELITGISLNENTLEISESTNQQTVDLTSIIGQQDFSNGGDAGGTDRSLGNTDEFDLSIITNNESRIFVQQDGYIGVGITEPQENLDVAENLLVRGDLIVQGSINADFQIDEIHVSKITGLLGQGYTNLFPDVINNLVNLELSGINITEKVLMTGGMGHETEIINVPVDFSVNGGPKFRPTAGVTQEFPVIFETGTEDDVNTLKAWFDSSDPQAVSGTLVIKDLSGNETDRWNFYEYIPNIYEPGNDGRTRFTLIHSGLPDNVLHSEYLNDFGSFKSFNAETDKFVEIEGVSHSNFAPAVEVDYDSMTITLIMDYVEGAGIYQWAKNTVSGIQDRKSMSIIETTDGNPQSEISRRNYFECLPKIYELINGFGQSDKLQTKVVIVFGFWEEAK